MNAVALEAEYRLRRLVCAATYGRKGGGNTTETLELALDNVTTRLTEIELSTDADMAAALRVVAGQFGNGHPAKRVLGKIEKALAARVRQAA